MSEQDFDREITAFIEQAFAENYEALRVEVGRGLSASGRQQARRQVLLYWRKLREIAESVTDTEVLLTLPGCESPKARGFAIQGIVDIVREADRTTMYDIKAHDPDYVRQNKELYQAQLNAYAHIWRELRQEELDETAIIATVFPPQVRRALDEGEERALEFALDAWDPLIPLDYDLSKVDETVRDFGEVVDDIEDGAFAPRTPEELAQRREAHRRRTFATDVCRNCDARFSCASYRQWALGGGPSLERFRAYFSELEDRDVEAYRSDVLEEAPDADRLIEDFGR